MEGDECAIGVRVREAEGRKKGTGGGEGGSG